MRDSSIESEKERTELTLLPTGIEVQESPFPRDISRSVFHTFAKFSPEAKSYLVDKLRAVAEQLIINSSANAAESGLDVVSAKNVEIALSRHYPAPRSRPKKFGALLGGVFLG